MSPEAPKTLEELKLWAAAHDGRINAWWDAQHSWNRRMDKLYAVTIGRISAVEKRMIWWAGFASGVGGLLGGALSKVL